MSCRDQPEGKHGIVRRRSRLRHLPVHRHDVFLRAAPRRRQHLQLQPDAARRERQQLPGALVCGRGLRPDRARVPRVHQYDTGGDLSVSSTGWSPSTTTPDRAPTPCTGTPPRRPERSRSTAGPPPPTSTITGPDPVGDQPDLGRSGLGHGLLGQRRGLRRLPAVLDQRDLTVPAGDGIKTMAVEFRNGAGAVSAPTSDTINLDQIRPRYELSPTAVRRRRQHGDDHRLALCPGATVKFGTTASSRSPS